MALFYLIATNTFGMGVKHSVGDSTVRDCYQEAVWTPAPCFGIEECQGTWLQALHAFYLETGDLPLGGFV